MFDFLLVMPARFVQILEICHVFLIIVFVHALDLLTMQYLRRKLSGTLTLCMLQPLPNIPSLVRIPSSNALLDVLPNILSLVRVPSFNALLDVLPNILSLVRVPSFGALPNVSLETMQWICQGRCLIRRNVGKTNEKKFKEV